MTNAIDRATEARDEALKALKVARGRCDGTIRAKTRELIRATTALLKAELL